ncbi:polysaccharide biosynthesis tyrosine autokinase [Tautonia rosea]|uniref:polysaccharide biosynthesis tyrosine autokinase n=1 Tax=Tautonia rosea TaxID=2728037 RepID=UPI0014736425|nr:polysaccharide biosynthesis tyrosine autokinase [Tautonia rosea]
MERIILPYGGQPAGVPQHATAPSASAVPAPHSPAPAYIPLGSAVGSSGSTGSTSGKSPSDYLRALRRRFWLIVLVGGVLATIGTTLVLRQKPVYRASAQIEIVPPQFDSILASLMADDSINLSAVTAEQYEANRLAHLRNRQTVEDVLRSPRIGPPVRSEGDPVEELLANLKTNRLAQSTRYDVHLEGNDPYRVATILDLWLEEYERDSQAEVDDKVVNSQAAAEANIKKMYDELSEIDRRISQAMANSPDLSPDGTNRLVDRYQYLDLLKRQKQNSLDQLQHQLWIARMFPKDQDPGVSVQQRQIADLMDRRQALDQRIGEVTRVARNPRDPAITRYMKMRRDLDQQIQDLQEMSLQANAAQEDPTTTLFTQYREVLTGELTQIEEAEQSMLRDIQRMAPDHNQFLTLLKERERTAAGIAMLRAKIDQFDVLSKTQNKPVRVVQRPTPPPKPVRPGYTLMVALVCLVSMVSGVGTVLAIEHLDHSVRAPEQLTTGLTLPLLGVISRMKRTARLQRGGHLWTAGAPHSAEADAYRNLRASLVGMTCPEGKPAVTLLVTSAKAGEGKSTTALNLAATCARSGERTLLLEVDLRRPSLRPVFDDGEGDTEHDLGLVDVLRGEMPWQRTVVSTDIPNLDFLPSGDPSGVPVEVLGALEMKQLITAVSRHYDRVILDGPAILGLADCRMLGRIVDAAILVVRAGANDLRPVLRARTMLEQSNAPIVGVVFNGLCEDVNNWSCVSSYLDEHGEPVGPVASGRLGGRTRGAAGALAAAE